MYHAFAHSMRKMRQFKMLMIAPSISCTRIRSLNDHPGESRSFIKLTSLSPKRAAIMEKSK